MLHEERYKRKAEELAEPSGLPFTEHDLLYGEWGCLVKEESKAAAPSISGTMLRRRCRLLLCTGHLSGDRRALEAAEGDWLRICRFN